jgi:BA14K-like protein
MLNKFKIALAAAVVLGTASFAAMAANDNEQKGGSRELGPGGTVGQGVNPVFHPSMHKPGGDAAGCEKYFKTYDPATGTFIGADGKRHQC